MKITMHQNAPRFLACFWRHEISHISGVVALLWWFYLMLLVNLLIANS